MRVSKPKYRRRTTVGCKNDAQRRTLDSRPLYSVLYRSTPLPHVLLRSSTGHTHAQQYGSTTVQNTPLTDLEEALARVDDEVGDGRALRHHAHELAQRRIRVVAVHAQPVTAVAAVAVAGAAVAAVSVVLVGAAVAPAAVSRMDGVAAAVGQRRRESCSTQHTPPAKSLKSVQYRHPSRHWPAQHGPAAAAAAAPLN